MLLYNSLLCCDLLPELLSYQGRRARLMPESGDRWPLPKLSRSPDFPAILRLMPFDFNIFYEGFCLAWLVFELFLTEIFRTDGFLSPFLGTLEVQNFVVAILIFCRFWKLFVSAAMCLQFLLTSCNKTKSKIQQTTIETCDHNFLK